MKFWGFHVGYTGEVVKMGIEAIFPKEADCNSRRGRLTFFMKFSGYGADIDNVGF
jgi:hypothetical protein